MLFVIYDFLSFYAVMEVIFDLIRNSPNYTSFCNTTTSSIDLVVDIMIWLDACSPMTAVKLRVYDHYLMFFPDGASKPLDLLTYVGTEHNIHQVRIRNSSLPAHICASIYIYIYWLLFSMLILFANNCIGLHTKFSLLGLGIIHAFGYHRG